MEEIPKYYTILFNAVTNALFALESGQVEIAKEILIKGQQGAEDAFMDEE